MNLFIFSVCFRRVVFFGKSFRCSLKMAANFFDPNNRERQKNKPNRESNEWRKKIALNLNFDCEREIRCCSEFIFIFGFVSFLENEMESTCGPICTDRLISLFRVRFTEKWISIEICERRKYKTFCCNNHNLISSTRYFNWLIIRWETGEEMKCRVTASSNKYFGIRN